MLVRIIFGVVSPASPLTKQPAFYASKYDVFIRISHFTHIQCGYTLSSHREHKKNRFSNIVESVRVEPYNIYGHLHASGVVDILNVLIIQ